MELNKIGLIGGMLLASATTLSAAPTTVNDGKNMNNLTKIENKLNDANATIDLKVALRNGRWPIGHLEMVQSADITFPALRAAWYSEKLIPADNDYTLSAEFQPAAEEGMGGVISLLNNETGVGIVFQLNSFDAFQVGTVSFLADEEDANFTLDGLYNLDGSPAEEELGSAWSDLGEFDSSKFTIMKMTISPPTDEDKAALEDVTARITAVPHTEPRPSNWKAPPRSCFSPTLNCRKVTSTGSATSATGTASGTMAARSATTATCASRANSTTPLQPSRPSLTWFPTKTKPWRRSN